jgi:hypothetical protein
MLLLLTLCGFQGWSAFSGFGVLLALTPLNSYVTNQGMLIYKGRSKARDKRLSVLDELIGSVGFVSLFFSHTRSVC